MFLEEDLKRLREARFSLRAWMRYGHRVAQHSREHMVANPGAVRSVWSTALVFFALAFVAAGSLALSADRHLAYAFFVQTALAIVPTFALITFSLSLLRDRDGYRLSAINVPIALTLVRPVLVPGIVLFLVDRSFTHAFAVYLFAVLTDVADGWLARRWNQTTRLGVVLDPIVDIVFNLAIFAGLAASGVLATWVFGVAAVRYGVLLVGGACLYLFVGPVRIHPTLFGRLTGVVMSALVALLMLLHVLRGALAERLLPLTEIALGVLLAATVAQVVTMGWYNLRIMTGKVEAAGRVVGDVRWGAR